MRKILFCILTLIMCVCAFGLTACSRESGHKHNYFNGKCIECYSIDPAYTQGLVYSLINNDSEYSVVKYTGNSKNIIIPESYNDKPVTCIEERAFSLCNSLETIEIPNSVISIGEGAFSNCTSLINIGIPNSVIRIGADAFYGCDNLQYNIQGDLKYLGNSENKYIYLADTTSSNLTTVIVNSHCKFIGSYAFAACHSLELIVMQNNVTSIGENAFYLCTSLTSVTIPNSVTSIGSYAFEECSSLESIVLPNSLISVGEEVFSGCDKLKYNKQSNLKYLGNSENQYLYLAGTTSTSLTSITINANCKIVGSSAFSNCHSLTSIKVSDGNIYYESINGNLYSKDGKTLVQYAKGKTEKIFTIPNSVTSIGAYAFNRCDSLQAIVIPDNVTSIGDYAFFLCDSLEVIEISNNVTSIGDYAFFSCSSLTSVTIPNSVKKIGEYAFRACSSLTSITIPNSVINIGSWLFAYCSSLTKVNYLGTIDEWMQSKIAYYLETQYDLYINNEKVTEIETTFLSEIPSHAFYKCKSLTSVTIPNSVKSIGFSAFYGCNSLTSITLPFVGETKEETSNTHFGYIFGASNYSYNNTRVPTKLKDVTITGGANIAGRAFYGCNSLTSVKIPNSVNSIGSSAFYGCNSLTSITLPFVGATKEGENNTHFGYIFGANSYSYNNSDVPSTLKTVTITGGITIADRAFYGCKSLENITIPKSVKDIGAGAFSSCEQLINIVIPNSVKNIGEGAFSYCTSLTIYCQAEGKPNGWNSYWNYSNCPVVWGYKG